MPMVLNWQRGHCVNSIREDDIRSPCDMRTTSQPTKSRFLSHLADTATAHEAKALKIKTLFCRSGPTGFFKFDRSRCATLRASRSRYTRHVRCGLRVEQDQERLRRRRALRRPCYDGFA